MKVLIACEESQAVCIAFREKGHEAYSCDLQPCSGGHPEWHYQGDVFDIIRNGWDIIIAHPPCTRLANSGVSWLEKRNLWKEMREGAEFFRALMNADIPAIAVENPIPHKYALQVIGRKYDQIIHPWMFGHGETKATCLWLKNLPPLMATNIVTGRDCKIWKMPPSQDRAKLRSKTFKGIADAMANQWGTLIL
jgi:hypothetical protein